MSHLSPQNTKTVSPEFNITKDEGGVTIHVDLPGIDRETLELQSEKNHLTLSASRSNHTPEDWQPLNDTTVPEQYKLRLKLGSDLDPSAIRAKLAHGTLALTIPKKEELKARRITITSDE